MYTRQLSKLHRYAIILTSYLTIYLVVSYVITPEVTVSFVSEEVRVGDKFALIFLVAPKSPAFTDSDGAEVFHPRCGKCFITNNKGFLPLDEYDAVLMTERRIGVTTSDSKTYVMDVRRECVRDKLKGCVREPRVMSLATGKKYDLCSLCEHLHAIREPEV